MLSGSIVRIKVRYMKHVLHKQIYAGILAVLNDNDSYYQSSIGHKGEYNHFYDNGREAIIKFIEQMAPLMLSQEKEELDLRAKKMVIDELKK